MDRSSPLLVTLVIMHLLSLVLLVGNLIPLRPPDYCQKE
jgi:hypothetical protein